MTMSRKILWLSVVLLSFCLLACSTTKITDVWQNQDYSEKPLSNILVIGQFLDEEVCRMSELEMVRDLKRDGLSATAAYSILSAGGRSSVSAIDEAIKQHSFDGVLISKVADQTHGSSIDSQSACVSRWDSDYRQNQRYSLSPCQVGSATRTTAIFTLESNLYNTQDRVLIMKLSSKTSAVRPAYKLIQGFGKVVTGRLLNTGMLAKASDQK